MSGNNIEQFPDRIAETLRDKTILLTGATGFVGKIFLEKVLRACSDVKKVYVLVKSKYNKDAKQRMKEVFEKPVFDLLRKEKGNLIFHKVETVQGDLSMPDLNLSQADRMKLCDQVEFIYHCASTTRFDLPLKESTLLNVRGTKLMLDLAKECNKLSLFMYVSTAFCQVNQAIVEEKTYPPPKNPHHIIAVCEYLELDAVEKIKTNLLGEHPNTYSFTKALSEGLVNDEMDKLPVVITRPSVVIPIKNDPLPGYSDSLNGPMGLLIAGGKGVLRTMYAKNDGNLDYIPVDLVANNMLLSTFDYIHTKGKRKVYNIISTSKYKLTMNDIITVGMKIVTTKYPFNSMLWYPGGSVTQSKIIHYFIYFFCQLLPAILLDGLLAVLGQKPFLIRVQRKLLYASTLFKYYANRHWKFSNEEVLKAEAILNPRERKNYETIIREFDIYDYFTVCAHAARLYNLNEPDERLPAALRLIKIMWVMNWLLKCSLSLGGIYYIYKKLQGYSYLFN